MQPSSYSSKVNILLVDDHEENLVALETILVNPHYRLVKCTSGRAALRELLRDDFAVILLDVMMPEMDGFELATLIRKREKTRHTPLIFLTALAREGRHIYRGYSVGAVDYIQKPLDPEIVVAKVNVFVDLFRKSKQIEEQGELLRQSEQREKELQILKIKKQSERRYRQLAEAIPQIVWRASSTGKLLYFNHQWKEYNVTSSNALQAGQSGGWEIYRAAFHPDDFPKFFLEWQYSLRNLKTFEYQCRLRRLHSSQYRWHLCRALPERDAAGKVETWLGTWIDIHEQKKAEERQSFLAQAGKGLASSLDYVTTLKSMAELAVPYIADWCAIDIKDQQGQFKRVEAIHAESHKCELMTRLKDLPLEVSKGQYGVAVALQTSNPTLLAYISSEKLRNLAQSNERYELLSTLGTHSIMSVPLEVRGQTLGALTFVAGDPKRTYDESDLSFAIELTRHAALAFENARLYKVAHDSNRLKDEFLATVSHELRTPLSAVLGWSELLLNNQYDEDTMRCLETVQRNAQSLANLVEDLLDVSRIISGKILLDIQKTELKSVIEAAVETVLPAANAKGIELLCNIGSNIKSIMGDPARIQQIAWNLASNAIKFTPKGGHVKIDLQKDTFDNIVLRVVDDGIGLRPDFIPHIFERFTQVDGTTTRQSGGLGLGLAIVRHLVELHGGSVEAESLGEGAGSVFTVRLPINTSLVLEGPMQKKEGRVSLVESEEKRNPSLDGLTVLVVDDQEDSRTLIGTILTKFGAKVAKAASVREAIKVCKKQMPHVILSDLGMPKQDGFALLRRLREIESQEGGVHVPVAAITAHVDKNSRARVIDAGFDAYLSKPVQFPELVQSVASLAKRPLNSPEAGTQESRESADSVQT